MFNLNNKIALVTGASSGIGMASAVALARQGAKVVVAARRVERLQQIVSDLAREDHQAVAIKMDVTKKEQVQNAVMQTVEKFGRLDILVNNAGVLDFSPFLEMTEEKWDLVIDTNLKGYFFVAQAAAREMAKNKSGRIINIASIASGGVGVGFPGIAHYCASKGAVVAFTESLAVELAPLGILVNCIGPGLIESEMTANITSDPKQMQNFSTQIPLKRAGKPEEIASMVVYLASDESSYTTGSTIYIDGGWLAS